MKFKHASADMACGTCLRGYLYAKFSELVAVFGRPTTNGDGDKVDAQWILEFDGGTIATIYNYKDGKNYMGRDGMPVAKITVWHIGGSVSEGGGHAVDLVHAAVALSREAV